MRIVLVSPNLLLHNQWKKAVKSGQQIVSLNSINEKYNFNFLKNDILLFDLDNFEEYLEDFLSFNVICLSSRLNCLKGYRLLKKGVKAYGNSYMTPFNLQEVINNVSKGMIWVYPELMSYIITNSSIQSQKKDDSKVNLLSKREFSVAKEVSKGLTNKEIAKLFKISERTVKAHISSCFTKLEINERVSLGIAIKEFT